MARSPDSVWVKAMEAQIDALRLRRTELGARAKRIKEEGERAMTACKLEYDALKVEIEALKSVLEVHANRLGVRADEPALRVLALEAPKPVTPHSPRQSTSATDELKVWVAEHDGDLFTGAFADRLLASGRYKSLDSARSALSTALASIGAGFVRVDRGHYRFHAIDGVPLHPDEPPAPALAHLIQVVDEAFTKEASA